MINSSLNIPELRKQFEDEGALCIPNFLVTEKANSLQSFLDNEMPPDWWYATFSPHNLKRQELYQNNEANKETITRRASECIKEYVQGRWGYFFYRTAHSHGVCSCKECELKIYMRSDFFLNWLSALTGLQITGITSRNEEDLYTTSYTNGGFLALHNDSDVGQLGLILNLTKDWKPEFGGVLTFVEKNVISKTIPPIFNNAMIFDVKKMRNRPHFVSQVPIGVDRKRIAFLGWFT